MNYLEIESLDQIQESSLITLWTQVQEQLKNNLTSFALPMQQVNFPPLDLKKTVLTLKVKNLNYEGIDEYLDPKLRADLLDFRLKKQSAQVGELLSQLEKSDENQLHTFG